MKKIIISVLAVMVTGCSTIWEKIEEPLKPAVNEDNYWKMPCIWDGTVLKRPWFKKENGN